MEIVEATFSPANTARLREHIIPVGSQGIAGEPRPGGSFRIGRGGGGGQEIGSARTRGCATLIRQRGTTVRCGHFNSQLWSAAGPKGR